MVLPPRQQAEAGEGIEDDQGEVVVVAEDEGEDTDIEGLLDQAGEHLLVRRERPEQARQGDVDRDQHARQPAARRLGSSRSRNRCTG